MKRFSSFVSVAPMSDDVVARFAPFVDAGIVDLWRTFGAGWIGDGYFRLEDPARAEIMCRGSVAMPKGAVVLFATGLGDLIISVNGLLLVMKYRYGVADIADGISVDELVELMDNPVHRDPVWEWQPYPQAAQRDGIPGLEQCYGFTPLLVLGGREDAGHLQLGGLYEHLAIITHFAGSVTIRGTLPRPN